MPFIAPGSSGSASSSRSGKGGFVAPTDAYVKSIAPLQQPKNPNAFTTPKVLNAKNQQNKGNFLSDTINTLGNDAGQFAKGVGGTLLSMGQAIPRGIKEAGISLGHENTFTPKGPIETTLYGKAPIQGLAAQGHQALSSVGNAKNAPHAVNLLTGAALDALNFVGAGGVKKAAEAELPQVGRVVSAIKGAGNVGKVLSRGADSHLSELSSTKILPDLTDAKINDLLPTKIGVKDYSTTSGVGVKTPVTMTKEDYVKQFSALGKSYDKAQKSLEGMPSLRQQYAAQAIDSNHINALNELDKKFSAPYIPEASSKVSKVSSVVTPDINKATFNSKVAATPAASISPLPFGDAAESPSGAAGEQAAAANIPKPPKGVIDQLPIVQKGDKTRQAIVNGNAAADNTLESLHPTEVTQAFKKVDPADYSLYRKLDDSVDRTPAQADARIVQFSKEAKNTDAFTNFARTAQKDYETIYQHRVANPLNAGTDIGHVGNYQQRLFDHGDVSTDAALQKGFAIKDGSPAYTKSRTLPSYDTPIPAKDAAGNPLLDANGKQVMTTLKPKYESPLQDYLHSANQTINENKRAALIKGLNEAHPGQITKAGYDSVTGAPLGNLRVPGAEAYSATGKGPKGGKLADWLNSRAPTKLQTTAPSDRSAIQKAIAGYQKVNKIEKSTQLAGGLFHGGRTAIVTGGHQLLSVERNIKHPVQQLSDNLKLIGSTVSKKAAGAWEDQLASDGAHTGSSVGMDTTHRARVADLTTSVGKVQADIGKTGLSSFINKIPGFKQSYEAVFERQIPLAKKMMFKQETAGLNEQVPADLAKMRKIADGLNKGIGGIDNAVSGLKPGMVAIRDAAVLGGDLNEGIVHTLFNTLKANSTDGRIARKFVFGSAAVATLPGMATLAASGKFTDPKTGKLLPDAIAKAFIQQYGDPQIPTPWRNPPSKTYPKGSPITLKLPGTFVSLLVRAIGPALNPGSTYDGNRLSGIQNLASARLAAPIALTEKLGTNTDFYGKPIYGQDQAGKPISPGQTAVNIGEQLAPIPIAQATKSAQGTQPWAVTGLNELGLRASTSTLPSQELRNANANMEFRNTERMLIKQQSPVKKQIDQLVAQGNPNQAKRVADQWNKSLNGLVTPFRSKYADHYNPAWDDNKQGFGSFFFKTSGKAFTTRQKNNVEYSKLYDPNY